MRSLMTVLILAALLGTTSCGSGTSVGGSTANNTTSGIVTAPQSPANPGSNLTKVLILFSGQPGASEEALVRGNGGTVRYTYHLVPAIAASLPGQAMQALANNPRVVAVEPDIMVQAIDTELDNTWGVKRIGAGTVHDAGNRGAGVKIASLDSGVDYNHPELDGNYVTGYDFVNNDGNPMDDNGHGTHTSGTMVAEDNALGVVGVAPEASLYALKVLNASGSGYFSDIIAGVQWCVDHGIQVTNNSYGSSSDPGLTVRAAFDASAAAGVLHIASAGNSGNPPGAGDNVGYPAAYDSVVAVAATDNRDRRARFSSTGPAVELAAPGVDILSTVPGGGYAYASGTSMASPHVAGTAALVIATGVTDIGEVRQILDSTADDLGDPGRDNLFGYGLVDAAEAAGGPPAPPDQAVIVQLSTDKSEYVIDQDTSATLTAVVTDENGAPISGLSAAFVTTLDGGPVSPGFTEGLAGTYTGTISLGGLGAGSHTVLTTVTDARMISGNDSATFAMVPAGGSTGTMHVGDLSFTIDNGPHNWWRVIFTTLIVDSSGNPVSSATVYYSLSDALTSSGQVSTGTDGTASYKTGWVTSGSSVTFTVDDVTHATLVYNPADNSETSITAL